MSDKSIHPELKSLELDQVKEYFKKVLKFYDNGREIQLRGTANQWIIFKTDYEKNTQSRLRNSIDSQFAGLLSAYAKRVASEDLLMRCPLCVLNNHIGGVCKDALNTDTHKRSPCPAVSWCHETWHRGTNKKSAYDLVKAECERKGIADLSWLPEWR